MKIRILFLFAFASFCFGCNTDNFQTGCIPNNLQDGVIAFYPFIDGDLSDLSGNQNILQNNTTAISTSDRNGNSSCAYGFKNSESITENLNLPNPDFLNNLDAFSIALWYMPTGLDRPAGDFEILLSRGTTPRCPNRRGEWSVGLYDCRRAVFGHNNSVWSETLSSPFISCEDEVATQTDTWHHVAAVYDNDNYAIYFNGQLHNSTSGPAGCSNQHLAQDIGDLYLGLFFNGKIDDVLIYDRPLSENEVLELYGLEPCCK